MKKLLIAFTFALLAFSGAAMAAPAKGNDAAAFVQNLSDTAISVLTQKTISQTERDKRFRVLLNDNFDVPQIGRFTLGRYWRVATPEQQQAFMQLFENAIVSTYSARFAKYSGQTLETTNVRKEPDSLLVQSRMISPDGSEPVLIDWRVKQADGGYKIIDVIVEGVSMSVTQRSEYASVIERNGGDIEALLGILRKKANNRQQASRAAPVSE